MPVSRGTCQRLEKSGLELSYRDLVICPVVGISENPEVLRLSNNIPPLALPTNEGAESLLMMNCLF